MSNETGADLTKQGGGTIKTNSSKKTRCLIVQIASLGDCLQSLLALRAAQQLYPNLEVHFLAREKFAETARNTPWIKSVFAFPTQSIVGPLMSGQHDQNHSIRAVAKWISPIIEEPWDMVINWSYSEASSYLTAIIPARIKLGYSRRTDTSFSCLDGWSQYIQGVVQENTPQNIHITDVLTTQLLTALQIHIGDPLPNGEEPVTSKNFFTLPAPSKGDILERMDDQFYGNHGGGKKWIGIQLGVGKNSRDWGALNWARLTEHLLSKSSDFQIVLLGSADDIERERLFLSTLKLSPPERSRIISAVGETTFAEWAFAVSRCSWLFTGETASVPLAGTLATPVVVVSNTPLLHLGSGPYGNGSYIVAPVTGGQTVSPEAAYCVWAFARQETSFKRKISIAVHFEQNGWKEHTMSVRAYRSAIRPAQNGGGVNYEQILPNSTEIGRGTGPSTIAIGLGLMTLEDWTAKVVGHIARAWYCGWVPPVGQELKREFIGPALIQGLRAVEEASDVLAKIYEQAVQTAEQMHRKANTLKSDKLMSVADREEFKRLGETLIELSSLVDRLAQAQSPLKIFSTMEKVFMHNLKGQLLSELGKETVEAYKRMSEAIRILKQWTSHTLELTRPVSVQRPRGPELEQIL